MRRTIRARFRAAWREFFADVSPQDEAIALSTRLDAVEKWRQGIIASAISFATTQPVEPYPGREPNYAGLRLAAKVLAEGTEKA